ncbi:uncharacterized protein TRAVEDRAFT_49823 [Trametes versicolor FP-101664 SS1]|uniref:uncharacterized protein n=1 Tax=Trametes versicolor (strain FP-101664) TaxID=717944 RepID=UPI0004624631|nr:uncharacterized protein TRAVEDRAFT_49823 [Trametes versicolor FP-101664 SS1]EIW57014.1 hypothetical protein TRAVEDRAFT_49823 [Trametes versicolor FP-101664 SS1]
MKHTVYDPKYEDTLVQAMHMVDDCLLIPPTLEQTPDISRFRETSQRILRSRQGEGLDKDNRARVLLEHYVLAPLHAETTHYPVTPAMLALLGHRGAAGPSQVLRDPLHTRPHRPPSSHVLNRDLELDAQFKLKKPGTIKNGPTCAFGCEKDSAVATKSRNDEDAVPARLKSSRMVLTTAGEGRTGRLIVVLLTTYDAYLDTMKTIMYDPRYQDALVQVMYMQVQTLSGRDAYWRLPLLIDLEALVMQSKGDITSGDTSHSLFLIRAELYADDMLLYAEQTQADGRLLPPIWADHKFVPVVFGDLTQISAYVVTLERPHGLVDDVRIEFTVTDGEYLLAALWRNLIFAQALRSPPRAQKIALTAHQVLGTKVEFKSIDEATAKEILSSTQDEEVDEGAPTHPPSVSESNARLLTPTVSRESPAEREYLFE